VTDMPGMAVARAAKVYVAHAADVHSTQEQ
jgi:hypothetical protein